MSFTVVAGVNGQYSAAASGTTYAIASPSSTIPAGSCVLGVVGCNLATTIGTTTCADNSTQTGAANVWTVIAPTNDGVALLSMAIFYCLRTTRAILSTDLVTVTQTNAATRRAGTFNAWTPSNGNAALDVTGNSGYVATSPVSFTVPAQAVSGDLAVEFSARTHSVTGASGYSHTAPAGWTAGTRVQSPSTAPTIEVGVTWIAALPAATSFTNTATYTAISKARHEVRTLTDLVVPRRSRITVVRPTFAGT